MGPRTERHGNEGIGQFIFVGSQKEADTFNILIGKLVANGICKGEFSKNELLNDVYNTLYHRMFPQQNFSDAELEIYPELKPLPSIYDYSKFKFLIFFYKTYSAGHPCRVMTGDLNFESYLSINSSIFWLMATDNNLKKIPKLFFIDASTYPQGMTSLKGQCPPKLPIELPPNIGSTFVAWIARNKCSNDTLKFFKSIVEALEQEGHKSFRKLFKAVCDNLKNEIEVDIIDKLEEDLVF